MFTETVRRVREAVYGVVGTSQVGPNQLNFTHGTAFSIAPGFLVTAGHLVHVGCDVTKPCHSLFEVIRAPEVGQAVERANLLAEDVAKDVALLAVDTPRSSAVLGLELSPVGLGTPCGSLGFPLAEVGVVEGRKQFNLIERFQGAHISAFTTYTVDTAGTQLPFFETDGLMYQGSSGCPGFLTTGQVFGMHVRSRTERHTSEARPDASKIETRMAISLWVPASVLIEFVRQNGVRVV